MSLFPTLSQLKETAVDLLFPKRCVGCGEEGDFLCHLCRCALPRIIAPFCSKCGKPLPVGEICSNCYGWQMEIDGIRSLFRFEGVVRQAIHQLKYKNLKTLAQPLAELVGDYWRKSPLPAEVLVAVPLHPRRLRQRGYNQSSLLAAELSKLINLPLAEGSLFRVRNTPPQAKTESVQERRSNVREAFACHERELERTQVLLLDDVCTSGATLDSCASALKAAGATSVWGLTVAREV